MINLTFNDVYKLFYILLTVHYLCVTLFIYQESFTNYVAPRFALRSNFMLLQPFWPTNSSILFVNTTFGGTAVIHNQVKLANNVI